MKVTREQAGENRSRVLQTAATLFRERGFGGIGVADLMKNAGLTHGAFYGQFDSKEDLMAHACASAHDATVAHFARTAAKAESAGRGGFEAVVRGYLSAAHRDRPGDGCVMAALGSEVAREGHAVRAAVTEGTVSMIDLLASLAEGATTEEKRRKAVTAYAAMIGGLVLARASDDEALSDEVLKAVADTVVAGSL